MHLGELQVSVDAACGGSYWPPLANLARLTEEVGELARALNVHCGPKVLKPGEPTPDTVAEMGDVLFTLAALANTLGVDLGEAAVGAVARAQGRRTSDS